VLRLAAVAPTNATAWQAPRQGRNMERALLQPLIKLFPESKRFLLNAA